MALRRFNFIALSLISTVFLASAAFSNMIFTRNYLSTFINIKYSMLFTYVCMSLNVFWKSGSTKCPLKNHLIGIEKWLLESSVHAILESIFTCNIFCKTTIGQQQTSQQGENQRNSGTWPSLVFNKIRSLWSANTSVSQGLNQLGTGTRHIILSIDPFVWLRFWPFLLIR